eukprot:gene22798-24063_t
MAIVALENFANDYVIYVGESIHTGTLMGSPVAPFGKEAPISGDLEDKSNNQEAISNSPSLSAVDFI